MISSSTIFPYRVINKQLKIQIVSAELKDNSGGTHSLATLSIEKSHRLVLYTNETPAWDRISLRFDCEVEKSALAQVASDGENVRLAVALWDSGTRVRTVVFGDRLPGDPRWTVDVDVRRDQLRGTLEVLPYLARSAKAKKPQSEQAAHAGAIVGWGIPVSVYVDEPAILPIGGDVDVRWISFKDDPTLHHARANIFSVDLAGQRPAVRLNKDHEDLRRAMETKHKHGASMALKFTLLCYVAQEVWMAIVFDALREASGETEIAGRPSWPTTEWRADALKRTLQYLRPGLAEEDALAEVLSIYDDRNQLAQLMAEVSLAVQSAISVKKNVIQRLES